MNFYPNRGAYIVEPEAENVKINGIFQPAKQQTDIVRGVILVAGPGVYTLMNEEIPPVAKAGDTIFYTKQDALPLPGNGRAIVLVAEPHIKVVIPDEHNQQEQLEEVDPDYHDPDDDLAATGYQADAVNAAQTVGLDPAQAEMFPHATVPNAAIQGNPMRGKPEPPARPRMDPISKVTIGSGCNPPGLDDGRGINEHRVPR